MISTWSLPPPLSTASGCSCCPDWGPCWLRAAPHDGGLTFLRGEAQGSSVASQRTTLIVDDEAEIRETLSEILTGAQNYSPTNDEKATGPLCAVRATAPTVTLPWQKLMPAAMRWLTYTKPH